MRREEKAQENFPQPILQGVIKGASKEKRRYKRLLLK